MVKEKILSKGKKLDAAFKDQKRKYDRTDWKSMRKILKVYGVGGVIAFYND